MDKNQLKATALVQKFSELLHIDSSRKLSCSWELYPDLNCCEWHRSLRERNSALEKSARELVPPVVNSLFSLEWWANFKERFPEAGVPSEWLP